MLELPRSVRRLEVVTGVGSRRRWSDAERDRILAEILAEAAAPGAVVSVVARRHGMSPQHLFMRLRAARRSAASLPVELPLTFVPALVEDDVPDPAARRSRPRALHRDAPAAEIELNLAGVTVRIGARAGSDDHGGDPGAEGHGMIGPSGAVRVMMATRPLDFCKGMDGLAALVRDAMSADPSSGTVITHPLARVGFR